MAAQFSLRKGRPDRRLSLWIARAMSSLPVPISPSIRTVESVGDTNSSSCSTDSNAGLPPMICSNLRCPKSFSTAGIAVTLAAVEIP